MKYSQIRIALLTFTMGLVSIPFANFLQAKWIESSVELPEIESESPVVRVCPERSNNRNGYVNGKYDSFFEKCISPGGSGGGSSGYVCTKGMFAVKNIEKPKRVRKYKTLYTNH